MIDLEKRENEVFSYLCNQVSAEDRFHAIPGLYFPPLVWGDGKDRRKVVVFIAGHISLLCCFLSGGFSKNLLKGQMSWH